MRGFSQLCIYNFHRFAFQALILSVVSSLQPNLLNLLPPVLQTHDQARSNGCGSLA